MLFTSTTFLFEFLPIVFLVSIALELRGHQKLRLIWLILASLFFYAYWKWEYLYILIASVLSNYALSLALAALKRRESRYTRWSAVFLGIALNLAALGYFKYSGFITQTVDTLTGANFLVATIMLPLAISFFTFQQNAFFVDFSNEPRAELPAIPYVFFATYFPHLVAGPICYRRDIIPQLGHTRDVSACLVDVQVGLAAIIIGLFKKLVLASSYQAIADPVFASGSTLSSAETWRGVLAFRLQIYCDFSAYSDIAIGLGIMFEHTAASQFLFSLQIRKHH